jgi:hypothetical protein
MQNLKGSDNFKLQKITNLQLSKENLKQKKVLVTGLR